MPISDADLEIVSAEVDHTFAQAVDDLAALCRFSSTRDDRAATLACADWLRERFARAGLAARLLPVEGGNPVVYASADGATARRLLFVNHYDVEVAGELAAWTTPPFAPDLRDGRLYGRGTADNKGCLLARLWAVEAWLRSRGRLPCGVAFAVEAKTDIFAPHFDQVVAAHRELFRADACLWENALNGEDGRPTLRLGDKGMCALELRVEEQPRQPLSSQYAVLVPGAGWELVWALAALRPRAGEAPDWLREDVAPLAPEEEALLDDLPLEPAGQPPLLDSATEQGRRLRREPTCNLSAVVAGTPPRSDAPLSAIPRQAAAYLDLRLLPDQDPERIAAAVADLLAATAPGVEVRVRGALRPHRTRFDHPFVATLRRAARRVWRAEPRLEPLSTASGTRQAVARHFDVPIVGTGIAYAGSRIGRPDEHVRLDDYRRGILFMAALLGELAS